MGQNWVGKVMIGDRGCVVHRKAEVGSTPVVGTVLSKTQIKESAQEAKAEEDDNLERLMTAGNVENDGERSGMLDISMVLGESVTSDEEVEEEVLAEVNKTIPISEDSNDKVGQVITAIDDTGDNEEDETGRTALWNWLENQMYALAQEAVAHSQPMQEENWKLMQRVDRMVDPLLRKLETAMNAADGEFSAEMKQHGEWGAQIVKRMPREQWGTDAWLEICRVLRKEEDQRKDKAENEIAGVLDTTILI